MDRLIILPFFTKRILLLCLFLTVSGTMRAQEELRYIEDAGIQLPLFRASIAAPYDFPHNGTYLVDTLGFVEGVLVFDGKVYPGLLLNLDSHAQHVLVRHKSTTIAMDLGRDSISEFTRGNKKYVNLEAAGYNVPAGFYEVIEEGRGTLDRKTERILRHLSSRDISAERYIGYDDPHYKRYLPDYFEYRETWYLVREDGSVQRLRRKKQIQKAQQYVRSMLTR